MADYKEIVGTRVKAVSANPSDPSDGQVWYNSTDEVLKYKKAVGGGAWSSGGNLNAGRRSGAHLGTQTAALYVCVPEAAKLSFPAGISATSVKAVPL
jgi:hypothetical protein